MGTGRGSIAAAGQGGGSSSSSAPKKAAPQPNGLGYSSAQWKQLQQLEAKAKSGQKLDAHEQHLLHVAHEKRLKAMAKPAPKPKAKAKPKTAKKTTAKKK